MIEILKNIYSFSFHFLPYSFVLAFIGVVILLISNIVESLKKNSEKLRLAGIFFLLQLFIFAIILVIIQTTIITKIRNEFIIILKNPNTQIIQNDQTFGQFTSAEMKIELQKIKESQPHHSGTEREMQLVLLTNGKTYNIKVAQDEYDKKEYWIFLDKYGFGQSSEEIGRIKSEKFK